MKETFATIAFCILAVVVVRGCSHIDYSASGVPRDVAEAKIQQYVDQGYGEQVTDWEITATSGFYYFFNDVSDVESTVRVELSCPTNEGEPPEKETVMFTVECTNGWFRDLVCSAFDQPRNPCD